VVASKTMDHDRERSKRRSKQHNTKKRGHDFEEFFPSVVSFANGFGGERAPRNSAPDRFQFHDDRRTDGID